MTISINKFQGFSNLNLFSTYIFTCRLCVSFEFKCLFHPWKCAGMTLLQKWQRNIFLLQTFSISKSDFTWLLNFVAPINCFPQHSYVEVSLFLLSPIFPSLPKHVIVFQSPNKVTFPLIWFAGCTFFLCVKRFSTLCTLPFSGQLHVSF